MLVGILYVAELCVIKIHAFALSLYWIFVCAYDLMSQENLQVSSLVTIVHGLIGSF